jgi:hypothetical protein
MVAKIQITSRTLAGRSCVDTSTDRTLGWRYEAD